MPKRYNTPHRSHVVKTRLTDEEYADFTERLAPYGISQSEFLRQAIRRTTIRPVLHVSSVNDELLSAVGKLTAEYPESFPAGELAGSCTLIENADLRQDGNNAVLTVTLADGPIHGRNFGDGYYRFTAETGYTGIADTGPYLRVTLNATDELFAGD